MAKSFQDIASDINELLRKGGVPVVTFTWKDFYRLCERERLKQTAQDGISNELSSSYQIAIAYGHNAVIACHDRNFSPVAG